MTLEERPETKLLRSVWDSLSCPYRDKLMKESEELCFSCVGPVLPNLHKVLTGVGPQATLLQARV